MINPELLQWSEHSGRDSDGDKFSHYVLSHTPSARILAKIYAPCEADNYVYAISFFYGSGYKGRKLDRVVGEYKFLTGEGAKEFVEQVVTRVGFSS